ncbi:MAG TPA: arylesterase, partial [Burkholderiales bacterium]|nr:arylesterase [Burkholderiales bacterium]
RKAKAGGAEVLLVGMRIPPNYGTQYAQSFERSFADLAREYKVAYVPFLLEGIATERTNFQQDNMHPTAAVQPVLLDTIWAGLKPLLRRGA